MVRALLLIVTVFGLLEEPAPAKDGPDLGENAALKYWQAFATLPRYTDAQVQELGQCLTMPPDAHAREITTRAAYSLRMMNRGAALPHCDWGFGKHEEGIDVLLPHGVGARVLANLACLRARLRFEDGQSAAALDDLLAAMVLGRHISRDGVNVMLLTSFAIESRTSEALAQYLPKLPAGMLKDLKTRLAALPPGDNATEAMRLEERWALEWFIRKVKEAPNKEGLLAFLAQTISESEKDTDPSARGRSFLEECGGTMDGVIKTAEEVRESYASIAKAMELPLDQFEKVSDREEMKLAHNAVAKVLFPACAKVYWAQARANVRRALLAAAIAVQCDGPDALKLHPDPVLGGPFEYVPFAGGFELRSKWKPDDKLRAKWKLDDRSTTPLTLTVGLRGT
jgi:hypothetical protein